MNDPTTLDVLMYLFEQCLDEDLDLAIDDQEQALRGELREAGFPERAVSDAFSWLESLGGNALAADGDGAAFNSAAFNSSRAPSGAIRHYTEDESKRLDTRCRGLLLGLEHIGLLDVEARERVIERAMALDSHDLDVESLRWVVLVVLLNLPGRETSCDWVEELLFMPQDGYAH